MNKYYRDIINKYYKSYKDNDREALEEILVQDMKFISSWATYANTKEMLDTIWPDVLQNKNEITDLEIFELENEFIVTYRLLTPKIIEMVELIKFSGQKISEIRVFTKSNNK